MPKITCSPPIQVKTKGGYDAWIKEIDTDDSDLLKGDADTPGAGHKSFDWNDVGIARGGSDSINIDTRDAAIADAIRRARAGQKP